MSSQCAKLAVMRSHVSTSAARKFSERLIGEDDAPAEGVVGPVALEDGDVGVRARLLEQQGEVETGRPAADHRDSQE